ncbi:MAG: hypothetical protein WBC44_08985 [Planctomycetaceae bacterium]
MKPARPTRGFTITEVVVSMILLGTVVGIVVPLTKRAIDQREQAQVRRAALIEVSNALERLVADPTAGPKSGEVREMPLPERLSSQLREPHFSVTAVPIEGTAEGRRFDAVLTWVEPNGRRSSPIRLSAFAFTPTANGRTP